MDSVLAPPTPPSTSQPCPLRLASAISASEPTHNLIFGPTLPSQLLRKAITAGKQPWNHPGLPPRPLGSRGAPAGKGSRRWTCGAWEEKTAVLREEIQNQEGRAGLSRATVCARRRENQRRLSLSKAAPLSPALPWAGSTRHPWARNPASRTSHVGRFVTNCRERTADEGTVLSLRAHPRRPRAPWAQRVNHTREPEIGQRGVASPHHPGQRAHRKKEGHHPGRMDKCKHDPEETESQDQPSGETPERALLPSAAGSRELLRSQSRARVDGRELDTPSSRRTSASLKRGCSGHHLPIAARGLEAT